MSSGKWRPFCLCLNVLKEPVMREEFPGHDIIMMLDIQVNQSKPIYVKSVSVIPYNVSLSPLSSLQIPQGGMPGMANPMMQHQAALFQQPPHNMMFLNMNPQGGAPGMIPMRGNPSLVPMGNAQAGTMIYRPNFNP